MDRRPGDWDCRSCQHLNFSRRDACQRCGETRPDGGGGTSSGLSGAGVRPGDWYCTCGAHNYASRSSCFKCGSEKKDKTAVVGGGGVGGLSGGDVPRSSGGGGGHAGWKPGDWICTRSGCNGHNYASRTECFRCNAPRESGV